MLEEGSVFLKTNVSNTFTTTQTPSNATAAVSAGTTWNHTGSAQIIQLTLTGAGVVTLSITGGIVPYASYKLMLRAGDTLTRTYVWNSAYKFPSLVSPLVSATNVLNAFDIISFIGGASNTLIYDGHNVSIA
jgi:hypothetical protein